MSKSIDQSFTLFYESPNNVPPPYHLEAVFRFSDFLSPNPKVAVDIQYLDREDFTKEELLGEGLTEENSFQWEGSISLAWRNRMATNFEKYKSGSCNPKDAEPFITLELTDTSTRVPRFLEMEEGLIQEFMQAVFEIAGKELPLYLGFQFKNEFDVWNRIEGEMSFFELNYRYTNSSGQIEVLSDWDKLQELMNLVYIAEFQSDKAKEDLTKKEVFAVFPGDGRWYIAGDSLRKPSGNNQYFDNLEDSLQTLFS